MLWRLYLNFEFEIATQNHLPRLHLLADSTVYVSFDNVVYLSQYL